MSSGVHTDDVGATNHKQGRRLRVSLRKITGGDQYFVQRAPFLFSICSPSFCVLAASHVRAESGRGVSTAWCGAWGSRRQTHGPVVPTRPRPALRVPHPGPCSPAWLITAWLDSARPSPSGAGPGGLSELTSRARAGRTLGLALADDPRGTVIELHPVSRHPDSEQPHENEIQSILAGPAFHGSGRRQPQGPGNPHRPPFVVQRAKMPKKEILSVQASRGLEYFAPE